MSNAAALIIASAIFELAEATGPALGSFVAAVVVLVVEFLAAT